VIRKGLAVLLIVVGGAVAVTGGQVEPPLGCYAPKLTDPAAPLASYCGRTQAEIEAFAEQVRAERSRVRARLNALEDEFTREMMNLAERDRVRRRDSIVNETPQMREARRELAILDGELADLQKAARLRRISWPLIGGGMAGAGGVLLLLPMLVGRLRERGLPRAFVRDVDEVQEEAYVPAERAPYRLADLVGDRRAALKQLYRLRPEVCDFCGKRLPPVPAGTLVHERLFKAVPADVVQPRKIPLGEGYRIRPPDTIACLDCGHHNRV